MLQHRIHHCPYCGRVNEASAESRISNPFCDECFDERVEVASKEHGELIPVIENSYLVFIPASGSIERDV